MGLFDKPATIIAAPKKALAKGKAEIEIAGVESLAMIDALEKTLETLRKTIEGEVKGKATERFIAHIAETGKRPDNFTATEGGAFASVQLRRKSTQYALSEEAVAVCRANGIEPAREIVTPQLFAINPIHAGNPELLGKVEAALAGIVPDNFIVVQPEVVKLVSAEETLEVAIQKKATTAVMALTNVACGPKLKNTDMAAILEFVTGLITAPAFGAAAEQAKAQVQAKTALRLVS